MSAGGSDFKSVAGCEFRQLGAKMGHLASRAARIVANFRAELHDRLVHFGFDVLFQNNFATGQDLLDMRTQLARLRIDDLKLFLNAESEDVFCRVHHSCKIATMRVSEPIGDSWLVTGEESF